MRALKANYHASTRGMECCAALQIRIEARVLGLNREWHLGSSHVELTDLTLTTMQLHRYWIRFDLKLSDPHPIGVLPGIGVTAYDEEDALRMIRELVFVRHPLPQVKELITDIDVSTLDDRHVRPNMANPVVRGVWFPKGYQ